MENLSLVASTSEKWPQGDERRISTNQNVETE